MTHVVATPGNNQVEVTWSAPANATDVVLTEYYVQVQPEGRVIAVAPEHPSAVVSGLKNGVEVSITVYAATADGSSAPSETVTATPTNGMEGEVAGLIVQFAPGTQVADGEHSVPGEDKVADVELTADREVAPDVRLVELSESVSLPQAKQIAAQLETDPAVTWAVPDQFLFTAADPVDPALAAPVPNDADYASHQWNLWDTYGIGIGNGPSEMAVQPSNEGEGSTVAVIDTGITAHPDLDGQLVPGYDFVSDPDSLAAPRVRDGDPVAFDADGTSGWDDNPTDPGDWRGVAPVRDSSWHGTQIAGVIAAKANNIEGITGIAPKAKIEPIRALSWRGGLLSDIVAGITWASGGHVEGAPDNANPANVINMSFAAEAICSVAMQQAIDDAVGRGVTVVAAAGNANDDVAKYTPANCGNVISVAATGRDGKRAPYSNYGAGISIAAPGGNVNADGGVRSTSNTGTTVADQPGYTSSEGTSIAAAHVSAAAALLHAADPNAPPAEIRTRLGATESIRPFADGSCDTDPAKTCGAGIISLAQIASVCTPTTTTDGNATVVKFLTAVTCQWFIPTGVSSIDYLIVGGGGGGGGDNGGGGGAGGYRAGTASVTGRTVTTIWAGSGGGGGAVNTRGGTGSSSTALGITAIGGGGGGGGATPNFNGADGGSGGGGAAEGTTGAGGAGNVPAVTPAQGTNGGSGYTPSGDGHGGGGGGATSAGTSAVNGAAGVGGAGKASSITGTSVTYAGGGGGGGAGIAGGAGGAGGGGAGSKDAATGTAGTANTGGGGGGGGQGGVGGAGGSGIVVLRFVDPNPCVPTTTTSGNNVVVSFTATGTCTWTVPADVTSVEYLIVGGGGGGGSGKNNNPGGGGGGGGGGVLTGTAAVTAGSSRSVTVGAGGAAGTGTGGDSAGFGVTAKGGGGGASEYSGVPATVGGSGGGGGGNGGAPAAGTAGQGFGGGAASRSSGSGGGGANAVGVDAVSGGSGGAGGAGKASSITGTANSYGGGGGGGGGSTQTGGAGGAGGGGAGGNGRGGSGVAGTANTGGGGGGAAGNIAAGGNAGSPAAGGSGVVIVRYTAPACSTATTTSGRYTLQAITTVGYCLWTVPSGITNVGALVVGGGGGGGTWVGGGGGGGGVVENLNVATTPGASVLVQVGAGGVGAVNLPPASTPVITQGANGSPSSFGAVSALGGGVGASWSGAAATTGGTGGGGSGSLARALGTPGQGYAGGGGNSTAPHAAGGGGGAGGAGVDGNNSVSGGAGGIGRTSAITGAVYGGGGGGGVWATAPVGGAGGTGGGGAGANQNQVASDGVANTGGGGGGQGDLQQDGSFGATGGSGIVVVRYLTDTACVPTTSTLSGYTIQTFTEVGTCNWTVPAGVTDVEYLVVGGGGGGGGTATDGVLEAGGGGAGGVRSGTTTLTPGASLEIGVGDGGFSSVNGAASSAFGITSAGGGAGGNGGATGSAGASGGGGAHYLKAGGAGTSGQGNAGGSGGSSTGGGGGGAGAAGNAEGQGFGGDGVVSYIKGTPTWYGGGGAGAKTSSFAGQGGGGASTSTVDAAIPAATDGTGGGGGGTYSNGKVPGGQGGSGIVIVRYLTGTCSPSSSTSGPYTILTFTAVGGCTWTVPAGVSELGALVVAGGGGGGAWVGGGGGGGGVKEFPQFAVTPSSAVVVKVGAGGNASSRPAGNIGYSIDHGTNGDDSSFGTVTASGGGRGASWTGSAATTGGSGGGGSQATGTYTGKSGTSLQGFAGGAANDTSPLPAGGGGGAGGPGDAGSGSAGGEGGLGRLSAISGQRYGGGGGGGVWGINTGGASGGVGGGGAGAGRTQTPVAGTANTGGGGGGKGQLQEVASSGAPGGSGVVVVRYLTAGATCAPTSATVGVNTVLTFSGVGPCSWTPPAGVTSVDVLSVGGGGGGGGAAGASGNLGNGGGGGGGRTVYLSDVAVTAGTPVSLTVGAGGAGGGYLLAGSAGGSTSFGSTRAAVGGGGGGAGLATSTATSSGTGGGSGNAINGVVLTTAGGAGNFDGAGGGAGAYGAGVTAIDIGGAGAHGGRGGYGYASSITGTRVRYGGGGGGGGSTPGDGGAGGPGGGGAGALNASTMAAVGTNGLGGGGGGGGYTSTRWLPTIAGANGGSGVIVVRYHAAPSNACTETTTHTGAYTVHQFTQAGTCVWAVPASVTKAEYLIVAGGGGGGGANNWSAGGGGAGGMLTNVGTPTTVTAGSTQAVRVGDGGLGASPTAIVGAQGENSSFLGLTAIGGGGGGGGNNNASGTATTVSIAPTSGGSGGGGGAQTVTTATSGAAGTSGQGNAGGAARGDDATTNSQSGGGGGGKGGAGGVGTTAAAGAGGVGLANAITGTSVTYAAGGAGGRRALNVNGTAGTDARGNGGSGAGGVDRTGGDGGTGIVVARHQTAWSLAVTTAPVGGAAGELLATQPVLELRDGAGAVDTTDNVTVVTATVNNGGAVSGTTTATAVNGVVTFSGLKLGNLINTNYTITFTTNSPHVALTATAMTTVTHAAASKIVLTQQPSSYSVAGVAFATQPTVQVQDQYGNLVSTGLDSTRTIALTLNGTGSISGTASMTAIGGVAAFTGLSVGTTGTGKTFTATASRASVANFTVTSSAFAITPATSSLTQSTVTETAASLIANGTSSTTVVVALKDAFGNSRAVGGETVTMSASYGTLGTVLDNGNGTYTATYKSGTIAQTVTITATVGGSAITDTATITLNPGAASAITVIGGSNLSAAAGSAVNSGSSLQVKVVDASGNARSGDALTLAVAAGGGTLASTSVTTAAGVADVPVWTLGTVSGVNRITVTLNSNNAVTMPIAAVGTPGPVTHFSATYNSGYTALSSRAMTAGLPTDMRIAARDQYENVNTDWTGSVVLTSTAWPVTLTRTITTGGFVDNVSVTPRTAGSGNTVTAVGTGSNGSPDVASATAASGFTVSPGALDHFDVTQSGGTTALATPVDVSAAFPVRVTARDNSNNIITTWTGSVALTSGAFAGTVTATIATNGYVDGVSINPTIAGTGKVINAVGGGKSTTPASAAFTVTPGAPASLRVLTQPIAAGSEARLSTQPVVQLLDGTGNVVTINSTTVVTVSASAGATLSCFGGGTACLSATANAGVATFANLQLAGAVGTPYTLTFSVASPSLSVTSNQVQVTGPGAASQLAVTTQATSPSGSGAAFTTQPVVVVRDANGNRVTSSSAVITASVSTGGTLVGTTTATAINGVATFANLGLTGVSLTPYTITFASGVLTSTTQSVTVAVGAARQLSIATQPSGATFATAMTGQPGIQLRDSGGNAVSQANVTITARLASGTGTLTSATATTDANGLATFSGLAIYGDAGDYTLEFTSPNLTTTAASNTVTLAKKAQTISFTQAALNYGSPAQQLSATASSGLPISYVLGLDTTGYGTASPACTVSTTGEVTVGVVGNCQITATQAGNDRYSAAPFVNLAFQVVPVAPGKPTISSTSGSDGAITVAYTAPASTGGSPVTGYVIVATDSSTTPATIVTKSDCTTALHCTITGLTNGTAYTIAVQAKNIAGTGLASTSSSPVTPSPDTYAVGSPIALSGNQSVTATWTPVNVQTGYSFVSYELYIWPAGSAFPGGSGTVITDPLVSSHEFTTIDGSTPLSNGTSYNIRIVTTLLINASSQTVTGIANIGQTAATTPSAPLTPSTTQVLKVPLLQPDGRTVELTWAVPSDDGGAAITGYTATSSPSTGVTSTCTAFPARSCSFTGLEPGTTYTFSVTASNRMGASTAATTTYTAPSNDASLSALAATSTNLASSFAPATVTYSESVGYRTSSVSVTATTAKSASTMTINGAPVASGVATPIALSPSANTVTIVVTAPDTVTTKTYTVTLTRAGPPAALSVASGHAPAAGASEATLSTQPVINVDDAGGALSADSSAVVTVTASGGVLSGTTTVTAANGVATFTDLAFTGVANTAYTLTFGSPGLTPVTATITPTGAGSPASLSFTQQPSASTVAGADFAAAPKVAILDQMGNVTTSTANVVLSLTNGSGTLTGTKTQAAVNGVATFPGLSIDLVGNDKVLTATATLGSSTVTTTTSPHVAITPASVASLVLTSSASGSLAAAVDRTYTATLKDAYGNTVTGATGSVAFAQSVAGTLVGLPATAIVAHGVATVTASGGTIGSATVTATYDPAGAASPTDSTSVSVVEGAVDAIELTGSSADLTVGAARTFTAVLKDKAGNTVTAGTPSITFTVGGTATVTPASSSVAASAGTAAKELTSSTVGTATVTASATVNGTPFTSLPTAFSVVPGFPDHIVLTESSSASTLAAGDTRTLTATVVDALGNPVTNLVAPVTFAATNASTGTVDGLGSVLPANGVASVTASAELVGSMEIRATYGNLTPQSTSFTIVPGDISQVALVPSATGDLAAGDTRTFTATVKDAFGNTVTSVNDPDVIAFTKTTGSGTLDGVASATAHNGVASLTVTGHQIGSIQLTAAVTVSSVTTASAPVGFSVALGAPATLTLDSAVTDLASGATRTVSATITDAKDNIVTTATDSVAFTATSNAGTLTGTGSVVPTNGVASATLTGDRAGSVTITAALPSGGPSDTKTFTVVPGDVASIDLATATTDLAAGDTRAVTATLKDANDNVVTGASDVVTFTATGVGGVTGSGAATPSAGVAGLTLTGNTPGSVSVTAEIRTGTIVSAASAFTVVVGAPHTIALSASASGDLVAGSTRTLTATVTDVRGNAIPSYANAVVFARDSGSVGTVTGLGSATISAGSAGKTVTAQAPGAISISASLVVGGSTITSTPVTFDTVVGDPVALSLETNPSGSVYGSALTTQPVVAVRDVQSNAVPEADVVITATLTSGTGTLSSSTATTNGAGVATFSGLTIDGDAGDYVLTFESTDLTSVVAPAVTVTKKAQTITFANPKPSGTGYGVAPFPAPATSDSGLSVTVTSSPSAVCVMRSGQVNIVGTGSCTLTAAQAGNGRYQAAASVVQSFEVAKAPQAALTIVSPATVVYGTTLKLVATGGTGRGEVTFTASGASACTIAQSGSDWVLTPGGAGSTCVVTATKAADDLYLAKDSAAQTITTRKAPQVLAFDSRPPASPLPGQGYVVSTTLVSAATALPTGLTPVIAIAPASASVCTLGTGDRVTFLTSGTCTITAEQTGNANYEAAPSATQAIVVGSLNQSITFAQPASVAFGSPSVSLNARATSGLNVAYVLGSGTTNSACTVSATGGVSINAVGVCEIVASQAGDLVYAPASPVTRSFNITPGLPTQPHITSTSAGNESITVAFTAPGFTGGVSLASYQITATPQGGGTAITTSGCSTSAVPLACTIDGLVNGETYEITLAAVNAAGVGAADTAASAMTPVEAADAVGGLIAQPGDGTLAISWTPLSLAQLGGGTFLGYEVAYREVGATSWRVCNSNDCTGDATVRTLATTTISGLDNGSGYEIRIAALTSANTDVLEGNTAYLSEYPSTVPTVPRTATVLRLTPTTVQFSWADPISDGGAALSATPFVVSVTEPAGAAAVTCPIVAGERHCTVSTDLVNGGVYTFSVYAQNRMGAGPIASTTYSVPSDDATLSELALSSGALSPTFTGLGTAYVATVDHSVTSLTLTPTAAQADSVIEVDGQTVTSGTASEETALEVGENTMTVVVYAPDPRHTTTYTVTITRAAAPAPPPSVPAYDIERVTPQTTPIAPPLAVLDASDDAAVLLDGEVVAIEVRKDPKLSAMQVSGDGFEISLRTETADLKPVQATARVGLAAPVGGWVHVAANIYATDTAVSAYLVPRTQSRSGSRLSARDLALAVSLGEVQVGADGNIASALAIPASMNVGDYVLQINGITRENQLRSVNVDLELYASAGAARTAIAGCSFVGDSAQLPSTCRRALTTMARSMASVGVITKVQVTGVAYGQSTAAGNRALAKQRAAAIASVLADRGVTAKAKVATVTTRGLTPGLHASPHPVLVSAAGSPASTVVITAAPAK